MGSGAVTRRYCTLGEIRAQETHLVAATYNTIINMTNVSGEFFPLEGGIIPLPLSQTGRKLRPLPPL